MPPPPGRLPGLTPGATYRVGATWVANYQDASNAPFTVLDSSRLVGSQQVQEDYPPGSPYDQFVSSFNVNGTTFQSFGYFQPTGTTMSVVLSNNASGTVVADAVALQQIVGDHGGDDDFQLQPSSPASTAGNPVSYFFAEPAPNGGRIDLGAYGNTGQTTLSPAQLVQVLSPNGLQKYQLGQQVTLTWQSAGLTARRSGSPGRCRQQ